MVGVILKNSIKAILAVGAVGAGAVLVYLFTKPVQAGGLVAKFGGFDVKTVDSTGTTTRQSTGETAKNFRFWPLINVTPDVNGSYTVTWGWTNYIDGILRGSSGSTAGSTGSVTDITDTFAGLVGGTAVQLQLLDNRAGNTEAGSIAIGDAGMAYLGLQDGAWHNFISNLVIKVTSPSGATVTLTGQLNDNFKSVGTLSASFAGFALTKIT